MRFCTLTKPRPKTMKRALILFISIAALAAEAQTEVKEFFTGANEGVTYYLPDTKIEVCFNATCIKKVPGEFSRYADKYLRVKDAITEASSNWELQSAGIYTSGKPSTSKMFTVKLNNNPAGNIALDRQGIIKAINTKVTEPQEDAATGKIENGARTDASRYMTEEMLQATSTAKLAELTAKEIYAIRESKLSITRGQSENMPKDGMALQLMLDELDKQEAALMELFIGRTDTIYKSTTITIEPRLESDTTKAVLLRFSKKLGFLEKDNLAGEPVYYDLRDLNSVKKPTEEEQAKSKSKPLKLEGICYNVPGKAKVAIYTRTRKLIDAEVPVAQFGTTEVLSRSHFNKNSTTKVLFDTATGGIISIEKK